MQDSSKKSTAMILLVGSPENCPDIRYAAHFWAMDPVVYARRGNKSLLVVSELEYGRALRESFATRVATPSDLGLTGSSRRSISEWALAAVRNLGLKTVRVPSSFPIGVAKRLEKAGIRVICISGRAMPQRQIKTSEELKFIKKSQQAAVIAMRTAIKIIGESFPDPAGKLVRGGKELTSESVKRIIEGILLDHGCFSKDTIVACGKQSADPHEHGSGPLMAGQPIVIDIFPQHMQSGYWGDITRTVLRGHASPELKRMYSAVRAAQSAALSMVRSGVSGSSVHSAAAAELEKRGFKTESRDGRYVGFIHGTGHGVGLEIHEGPSVSLSDSKLEQGNVITIEPGLYYPELGGIRIEDTIVVTDKGWKYLVPCEKRFEI